MSLKHQLIFKIFVKNFKYKLHYFFFTNFIYFKMLVNNKYKLIQHFFRVVPKTYMFNCINFLHNKFLNQLKKSSSIKKISSKNKKVTDIINKKNKNFKKDVLDSTLKNVLKKKKNFFSLYDLYKYRILRLKFLKKSRLKKFLRKPTCFLIKNYLYFLIYGFKNIKHMLSYSFSNQQNSLKFFFIGSYTLKKFFHKILKDIKFSLNSWFIFNKFCFVFIKRVHTFFNLNIKNILLLLFINNFQKLLVNFFNNVLLFFLHYDIKHRMLSFFICSQLKLFLAFLVFFNIEIALINYILIIYDYITDFFENLFDYKYFCNMEAVLFLFYFIIVN